nr:zinc finger BED domain-containing protein RICESLEEPER 3 [Tanacetum cinerariifolium]
TKEGCGTGAIVYESFFVYNPDVLREQFAGLVIQRGLSFNHFDDEQTTRVFQKHFQPKYNHAKETTYSVLSRMAMNILSVQATSVASESAFSTSGRMFSIRKTRLTLASLEMCMCLKDHLDAQERKQDKSTLKTPIDFKEGILDAEVQANEAIPLSDEEIALDAASSEGSMSGPSLRGEDAKAEEECHPRQNNRRLAVVSPPLVDVKRKKGMAWAGHHGAKADGASHGTVCATNSSVGAMARLHQPAVPLPFRSVMVTAIFHY